MIITRGDRRPPWLGKRTAIITIIIITVQQIAFRVPRHSISSFEYFPENTLNNYTTKLHTTLRLEGNYEDYHNYMVNHMGEDTKNPKYKHRKLVG
jgi:hypothetical protein